MAGKDSAEDQTKRSQTGIPGLDDVLGGGFTPKRLYLVDGDPGAGKTTLALQYLMEGARLGEKVLYITLSETKLELTAVAKSHGWSLEKIEFVELVADESELTDDSQLTMYHPSEVELGKTTKSVLEAVERIRPSRVVFDSLSELRLLAQNSLKYRRQIMALKQFFLERGCTVLMLDDHTAEGTDKQLQSIAHGVVSMEQLAPEYGAERRRLRVLKFRGTRYRGGYHDFCIATGGLRVFPRLVAAEHGREFERKTIESGVSTLDQLLGGGLDRGTSTLLLGPAGAGKSTIAVHYAIAAAARGEHAVIFAFDESVATLRMRMAGLKVPFDIGTGKGQVMVRQVDPAELSPGEFAHYVRDAVDVDGATVVVIDSLNGYLNAMPEERFMTIQLHEMLTYLGGQGVTTLLLTAQHGLVGTQMQSPVDASYLADAVIVLRYFEYEGKVKKAISVLKKRSGKHEESIRELRMGDGGITLSKPLVEFQGILTGTPVRASNPPEGEPDDDG